MYCILTIQNLLFILNNCRVCNRAKTCAHFCFWGKSLKKQEALSGPRWPTLEHSRHSTNPRNWDLHPTSHCSLWVSHILPMNSQLLLLFFLVAEEEEGWRIFGLWQLLWQSSPAHTSSLWCSTPPGSAGEGSCSSHSCGYTESPGKTVVSSQQTTPTATSKPKKQRIHYRDTKGMVLMCFTTKCYNNLSADTRREMLLFSNGWEGSEEAPLAKAAENCYINFQKTLCTWNWINGWSPKTYSSLPLTCST